MGVVGTGDSTALLLSSFLLRTLFRDMRRLSLPLMLSGSWEVVKGSAMFA